MTAWSASSGTVGVNAVSLSPSILANVSTNSFPPRSPLGWRTTCSERAAGQDSWRGSVNWGSSCLWGELVTAFSQCRRVVPRSGRTCAPSLTYRPDARPSMISAGTSNNTWMMGMAIPPLLFILESQQCDLEDGRNRLTIRGAGYVNGQPCR